MSQKVALITGASRGIGKAIADQFGQTGVRIIAPTRNDLDLSSNNSIDSFLASLTEPIDILINDAGINRLGDWEHISDQDLEDTLQINLLGPLRLSRGVLVGMTQRKYGRIVNISSIWSIVSKPSRLSYTISKTGLNGATRALAIEVAPYGVLVNGVAPGYVNSELTRQNNTEQEIQSICNKIPLGRLAEPEEIARFVAFLCSEENTYLTGQCIVIDGGYTCL